MATIAPLPISFNPNDFTSDFLISAVGNYNSLSSTERSLYSDDLSFEPLKLDTANFDSSMSNPGFINFITGRKAFGPTVYVDEASEKRAQQGNVPSASELARRLRERTPMFREGESIPSYDPASGLTAQQFWSQYPSLMYAGQGLKGTIFGVDNKEQAEVNESPNVRPSYQQPKDTTPIGLGVASGSSEASLQQSLSNLTHMNVKDLQTHKAIGDLLGLDTTTEQGLIDIKTQMDKYGKIDLTGKTPDTGQADTPPAVPSLPPGFSYGPAQGQGHGDVGTTGVSTPSSASSPSATAAGICFVAGTMMTMGNGSKVKVEDIKLLDKILGADGKINEVIEIHRKLIGNRKIVSVNGSEFFCTEDHPFKTKNGWQAVNSTMSTELYPNLDILNTDLAIGDTVETEDGDIIVEKIDTKEVPVDTHIWNFLMSGDHTYVAEGFVMHNKFCFTPDTPVLLSNGKTKPIDKITIGTEILGFNDQGELLPTDVVDIETRDIYNYILIKTDTRKVSTTDEHPFYIGEGKYKRADSLQVNDTIYTQEGQELIPETITNILPIIKPSTVYCLHLEGEVKTYFAGGFAVHSSNTTLLGLDGESFTEENLENYFVKHNNDVISEASVI